MSKPTAVWGLAAAMIAVMMLGLSLAPSITRAATLPAQFSDDLVASVGSPTSLAFTPDGRLLITTQGGQLRVVENGTLLPAPALSLGSKLCTNSERGLLGVAVHPSFAGTRYVYLFYTFNKHNTCPTGQPTNTQNPVNRVSRFTLSTNNTVDPASELVLVDNIISPNGNHNAGDLHFGKDGLLYISVGDGGCDYAGNSGCAGSNDAARESHTLLGKILRITDSGAIPSTNPYLGSDSSRCNASGGTTPGRRCQETFASGLRNPFRIAFDSNASGTRFFINDVGQNTWEEISEGVSGADYGWNVREGFCANGSTSGCRSTPGAVVGGLTDPLHAYGRSVGYSITGGAFVPNGVWPSTYDGDYLFGDYGGKIMRIEPGSGTWNRSDFVTGLGNSSVVNMLFGPYGSTKALYYTTYAGGGQIRRISYTGAVNRAPSASIAASPTSGAAPLAVSFNGSGSSDPDGDALTYVWNFGDGSAQRETSSATTSYTYTGSGTFTASLVVRDSKGASSSAATLRIDAGNTAPSATITSPAAGTLFTVGQTLTLSATASDPQDGTLPASALSWRVIQHHNDHTHPYLQPTTGNNLTITAPPPEDLQATETSYLELELTVTDSKGLATVVRRNVQPRLVDVTFNTQPAGLQVNVNGFALTGPTTIKSWQNYRLDVSAPAQTGSGGQSYAWVSWSDGGAQAHSIVTPANASSYSATFQAAGGGGGLLGEYYDNRDFTAFRTARVDAAVDFNWGSATPPGAGLSSGDTFSARWTGSVTPLFSQTYTFYTSSDDGVRLWVNGQQLINNWTDHGTTENSGTIALQAGQSYAIRMEFYENGGGAVARLLWSSASQAKQVIPQSQLQPPAASNNGTGLRGEYFDNIDLTVSRTVRTDGGINFDWGSGVPSGTALTGADSFSARWTGSVEAPVAGQYTFTTTSDDGVRLWVCGNQLVDNWTDHVAGRQQRQHHARRGTALFGADGIL